MHEVLLAITLETSLQVKQFMGVALVDLQWHTKQLIPVAISIHVLVLGKVDY